MPEDCTNHPPVGVDADRESRETDPRWWLARAKSLVNKWRREFSPDEDEALAEAREAYLRCIALEDSSGNLKVQAQIGLAKLDFVVGDAKGIRLALARLSEALREYPYSQHIEEVIYLLAIQIASPQTGQSTATSTALEYLDYLRDSYAPAREGSPTAMMYPRWDFTDEEDDSQQDGSLPGLVEGEQGKELQVNGLPAWALQFQIGLLASRLGNSTRGTEAMENAFTSYEAWLPRSRGESNDDTPGIDAIRRAWYKGVPHWGAWVQHPRTWLDLGDIAYRQGAGCFHVAAEAYRGALHRAGDLFPPNQLESIAYRVAKCCSRCGDVAGAVTGIEQLLYTRDFWSQRYRNHLKAWSETWRAHFKQEDKASLRLQCFWRVLAAKKKLRFLRAQARLVVEYTEMKRRHTLKHHFRVILQHCREMKRISRFAIKIQRTYRVHQAYMIAATLRSVRDARDAIVQAHASKLVQHFQEKCWKHWVQYHSMVKLDKAAAKIQALQRGATARAMVQSIRAARISRDHLEQLVNEMHDKCVARRYLERLSKHVEVGRRERAATTIQAMARGVVGRELASDERNRQARIRELLLNSLRKLGAPVLRTWYKTAHDIRMARMATKIQCRWRTFRARREWASTKRKLLRAREMEIEAVGRRQLEDKHRVMETWKLLVLERKVVALQRQVRVWLAKRVACIKRRRRDDLQNLYKRVMKPVRRQCFVALARNRTTCRREKAAGAVIIQCWWRCHLAICVTHRVRRHRDEISGAYKTVATNHERRLLARCCSQWRDNIPKQKAAVKIQAGWRGWEGRLRAAWFKDREIRFETFAGVLRAVSRHIVLKAASKEWRTLAWLGRMMTKLKARYRGRRARWAFAAMLSTLSAQQGALRRVALAKRKVYLALSFRRWSDHSICCQKFSIVQARIRGWLARRRLTATRVFTREATEMLILGGVRHVVWLHAKCSTGQAAWRGALARKKHQRTEARARVVWEICARIRDARRRRVVERAMSTWCWRRCEDKRMVIRLQAFLRGCRDRARVRSIRAHKWRGDHMVKRFQQDGRRRRMLRCFRAIEACLVEAYAKEFRSFQSHQKQTTEERNPGETAATQGEYEWGCHGLSPRNPEHVLPTLGESHRLRPHYAAGQGQRKKSLIVGASISNKQKNTTVKVPMGESRAQRHPPQPSSRCSRHPILASSMRRTIQARPGRLRGAGRLSGRGNNGVLRRRRPIGGDIVWEEEGGCEREHRDAGKCPIASGPWLSRWITGLERSADFVSRAFFKAFDEVRRMGLLRWLPAQLSLPELSFLCRYARVVVLDPAPAVEVWKLVELLRQILYRDPIFEGPEVCTATTAPPMGTPGLPAPCTIRPAIVLCNGDYSRNTRRGVGQTGAEAVAALVDGGMDTMVCRLCSSLSVTACSLGNRGAAAIAKACLGGNMEELCLVNCGIGNPGATSLALALGEGATTGGKDLRKLVLSDNRIGGVVELARALHNVITRTSIEVLHLSRCSVADIDVSILCKGLVDTRCRLRVLQLSGNVDLRDRGANDLAEALRERSKMSSGAYQSLQVDLQGCSINTWGCLALVASLEDIGNEETRDGLGSATVTLNLGSNFIKDVGVEAMSCALLGQGYDDHTNRQKQARRRQENRQSKSPRAFDATRIHDVTNIHQMGAQNMKHQMEPAGNFPPLMETPLYAAATVAWLGTKYQNTRGKHALNAWSVVLDGNRVSDRVVAEQGAFAGLGETALFRGCVLPETIDTNKSWAEGAFWTRIGVGYHGTNASVPVVSRHAI